ncbi:MAG: threonine-phosphate decarboxylase, partial [Lachnospiraceae bacterium]|nr:threonine-phosphate decarboxylase [Lachnospiraceae bacterium]
EKLMIRDCSTFPFLSDRYIRICFMNPSDNDRLLGVLLR